jgi:hypothetical protein
VSGAGFPLATCQMSGTDHHLHVKTEII